MVFGISSRIWNPRGRVIWAALTLRACMLLYGAWQDSVMDVKYTDIDYIVVSEAGEYVKAGESPYKRTTYRYSPIYAWIAAYVPYARVLFALADVLAGYLMVVLLRQPLGAVSAIWLLNPFVANISTRGSTDSITTVLVVLALGMALQATKRGVLVAAAAGAVLGAAVHLRIYPAIFTLPLLLHLWHDERAGDTRFRMCQMTLFLFGEAVGFGLLTAATVYMHGYKDVIEKTFLFHLGRTDHRHNFSLYSYLMAIGQTGETSGGISAVLPLLITLAGVALLGAAPRFRGDPGSAMFFQSAFFVFFNKVITSQYHIWHLGLLPGVAASLFKCMRSKGVSIFMCTVQVLGLVLLWLLGQAIWLLQAYNLEFLATNTYRLLFIASIAHFGINVYIFKHLLESYSASKCQSINKTTNDEKSVQLEPKKTR